MKKLFRKVASMLLSLVLFLPAVALAFSLSDFRPDGLAALALPTSSSTDIMKNVMKWFMLLVGFLSIIGFCISGILYFTAAGDEDLAKRAKRSMFYSIIGVVVALSGYVVWIAAQRMLDGKSTF